LRVNLFVDKKIESVTSIFVPPAAPDAPLP